MNLNDFPIPDPFLAHEPEHVHYVLAAGDAGDLGGLQAWCNDLPPGSYGQIFIEVFAPIQIEPFPTPPGIAVTWICRESLRPSPRPGIGIPRGQALADAVDAWFDEWLRATPTNGAHFLLWAGARSSSIMQSYWHRLEVELNALWAHEPHHPHA
ncbi:SIP domain-containing protein [Leucobacter sp. 1207-22]|uniref:SIP domain-containing protein n=1 Tax=Leucobacter sp. 1207-22 TaxID=2604456 RepID=UPI0040628ED4